MKGTKWTLSGLALLLLLGVFAQQFSPLPDFGPWETVRQQAHAQCQGYLTQGGSQGIQGYFACLQQAAFQLCPGGVPFQGPTDPMTYAACNAAATAGYPYPGKAVLTAPSYRVEVVGGVQRERDPRTNQVIREERVAPRLLFTLERTPQGVYRGVSYGPNGQPQTSYFVTPACELLSANNRPAWDGILCPINPRKPYLVTPLPSPIQGMPPNARFFQAGRLQDDFDGDGVVEEGYLATGGVGGQSFTSGWAEAWGYDPQSGRLKFWYQMAVRESPSAATTYNVERLLLLRVR
ncbi:hypothetical protein TJA_23360 [Thermus sp. LT1-2-5]|uniref:hypothetical protein n=1 Tax=Thermus sp. LT1-2-5 TaxID=3026935 RepID=UPI0030E81D7E